MCRFIYGNRSLFRPLSFVHTLYIEFFKLVPPVFLYDLIFFVIDLFLNILELQIVLSQLLHLGIVLCLYGLLLFGLPLYEDKFLLPQLFFVVGPLLILRHDFISQAFNFLAFLLQLIPGEFRVIPKLFKIARVCEVLNPILN